MAALRKHVREEKAKKMAPAKSRAASPKPKPKSKLEKRAAKKVGFSEKSGTEHQGTLLKQALECHSLL